jgi:hypothetical protein
MAACHHLHTWHTDLLQRSAKVIPGKLPIKIMLRSASLALPLLQLPNKGRKLFGKRLVEKRLKLRLKTTPNLSHKLCGC